MENNQSDPTESKSESGFYVDDFDVNEVLDISERLSDLDHESKSMLFFMSLTVFNELQNKFVKSYKNLLNTKRVMKTPVSEDEVKLYTILKESHQNFINTSLEEEEEAENRRAEVPQTQSSVSGRKHILKQLLRMLWRRYRIELFIKVMLIIFLLKLPYFCYFITTIVYILYCLGFFSLVARLSNTLRHSRNMQSVVRFFVNILDTLEPLLMIQLNQGNNAQAQMPQTNAHATTTTTATTNITNVQTTLESETQLPRSRTAPPDRALQEEVGGQQSGRFRQRPHTERPSTSETGHTQDSQRVELHREHRQGETSAGPQAAERESDRHGAEGSETTTSSPTGTAGTTTQQPTETRTTRDKPTYVEKFIYQVFFSFLLSLLPWWEPNPIYLEE